MAHAQEAVQANPTKTLAKAYLNQFHGRSSEHAPTVKLVALHCAQRAQAAPPALPRLQVVAEVSAPEQLLLTYLACAVAEVVVATTRNYMPHDGSPNAPDPSRAYAALSVAPKHTQYVGPQGLPHSPPQHKAPTALISCC